MSTKINFSDTVIPQRITENLEHNRPQPYSLTANHTELPIKVLFLSVAKYLSSKKNKKAPAVFKFSDLVGNFLFAAIVEYVENDNKEMPGNWSFYFTTNIEDVPVVENGMYLFTDSEFLTIMSNVFVDKFGAEWLHPQAGVDVPNVAVNTLLTVAKQSNLADESDPTGTFVVEIPGFVSLESSYDTGTGERVITIIPDGPLKKVIKDDYAIQK